MAKALRDDVMYRLVSGRRGRRQIYRFLREHDVNLLKEIDGIRLVSHADKIGRSLAGGVLWHHEEFLAALNLLKKKRKLKPARVFVDVGANIRMHSVYAARTGAFSKVVAIEPLSENFELVTANLALNQINNVAAVHGAAGAEEGSGKIYRNVGNYGKSSLAHDMGAGFETVSVYPLTAILKKQRVSPDDVSLVWIDVEGFESEVIAGMAELLECKTPLVVEVTPRYLGERLRDLVDRLETNYAQCHMISGAATAPIPFDHLRTLEEQIDIVVF